MNVGRWLGRRTRQRRDQLPRFQTTAAEVMTWRDLMLGGLERREGETQTVSAERYDELLKELERKNAALAEAAAHLFLVKKVSRILGGEK